MSDPVVSSNSENKRIDFNMIYPFTDKPKIVPFLKKAIAVIFVLGCLSWYGTHLVGAYFISNSLEINNLLFYKVEVEALTTGAIQKIEFIPYEDGLINILKKRLFMKSLQKSLVYALPLLMIYFFYQAFKNERYEKNIYSVSTFYLILALFYFIFIGFMLFWKENVFYNDFPLPIEKLTEKIGIKDLPADISGQSTGFAVDAEVYPSFYWIDKAILNQTLIWQLIRAANIVMIVVLFINIILLILLFILKPKIDKEKVTKIQQEIRKKAEANLAGKEYQMDPSIF